MSPLLTTPAIASVANPDAAAQTVRTTYPGGKGGAGVYQTIINRIPPHQFYLEPFLGAGTIMFHKRPARYDVGADINDAAISAARTRFADRPCQLLTAGALGLLESLASQLTTSAAAGDSIYHGHSSHNQPPGPEALQMTTGAGGRSQNLLRDRAAILDLESRKSELTPAAEASAHGRFDSGTRAAELTARAEAGILPSHLTARDVVVYADPPYLKATRKSQNRLYQFEPGTDAISDDAWHTRLLNVLNSLPCYVLLSGYRNELYEKLLAQSKWRTVDYKAVTRSGRVATETLWCNFPEPIELHDYRYLGRDKRERQRIKRKVQRWQLKLSKMTTLERQAIRAALNSV
jgi:hypothetical protein